MRTETLARIACALVVVAAGACGKPGGGDDGGDAVHDQETPPCAPGECEIDGLDSALGCPGVLNPSQLLDYHLTMSASDWSALKADTTNSRFFPARFRCGDEPELGFEIGIRRKRSGGIDKPGLKIDFNEITPDGSYFSLRKLSLENGVSSGSSTAELGDAIAEYLSWRLMIRADALASRAAFARVFVNGDLIGVYVNVEQVDKRFLRARGKDDEGWLFKHSGGDDDGYKTNETTPNPYEDRLCFWDKNPCATPPAAELETSLPGLLDVRQMLLFGGVNALIANSDAPFAKDNNFYFYDDPTGAPRLYLPWDLDTTMRETPSLFAPSQFAGYTGVLFTHWEDDYDALFTDLLATPLAEAAILGEIDRAESVAGAALDADPTFTGDRTADAVTKLKTWWRARHAQITTELQAHAP